MSALQSVDLLMSSLADGMNAIRQRNFEKRQTLVGQYNGLVELQNQTLAWGDSGWASAQRFGRECDKNARERDALAADLKDSRLFYMELRADLVSSRAKVRALSLENAALKGHGRQA